MDPLLREVRDALPAVLYPFVVDYCHSLREWHEREAEEIGFYWLVSLEKHQLLVLKHLHTATRYKEDYDTWFNTIPGGFAYPIDINTVYFAVAHIGREFVKGTPAATYDALKACVSRMPLEQRPRAQGPEGFEWLSRALSRASSLARR